MDLAVCCSRKAVNLITHSLTPMQFTLWADLSLIWGSGHFAWFLNFWLVAVGSVMIWSQSHFYGWYIISAGNSSFVLGLNGVYIYMYIYMPVLAFGYCRCLCLQVCLSVCVCVNHEFVCTITHHSFKLGSPNLDQRCKTHSLRSPLFCRAINLDLDGQI